jgi:large subunit ribosomal protein L21
MSDKLIHAVIQLGSQQFLVKVGDRIVAQKIEAQPSDSVKAEHVLMITDGETTTFGTPSLDSVTVDLQVDKQFKDDKIRVAKFRAKSRYRRVQGHRQQLTQLVVTAINQ